MIKLHVHQGLVLCASCVLKKSAQIKKM